ncbi:MAG: glucose 1-dehydrogenase [Rhizobiaceae bacterium]|nr:glucose 1-dehydrogenase [Rhizobiaceae bacterium]MCV0404894.1 glucose 1-dehydrogenase [Rhizobiaceae bacterium]
MRFNGKVVIVTGAASGMGLAAAELFAAEGAVVAINDLDRDRVAEVARDITCSGGKAVEIAGDVSDRAFGEGAVDEVIARHGRIDVLLNVAGYAAHGAAEDYEEWERMVAVNMTGPYRLARHVAKKSMIPNRSGAIVNISSLSGMVAHPYDIGYIAGKHGLVGVTKSLAVEWARYNIRVNCICPGFTMTGIFAAVEKKEPEKFKTRARHVPLGRAAVPREIASVMAFLASDDASYVTGLIMPVDGGQMALSSGWLPPEVAAAPV